jgi:L-xylulokinase
VHAGDRHRRQRRQGGRLRPTIDYLAATGHGKGAYLRFAGDAWPTLGIVSSDNRAARLAAELGATEAYRSSILARVTQPLWPSHSSVMLAWLRRERAERYGRIDLVLSSKDFVNCMLTGEASTDDTAATASGLYRTDDSTIDPVVLEYFGLADLAGALPEAAPSHHVIGGVRREVASATGLRQGTPVVAGLFDVNAAAIACAIRPDQDMSLVAGTWNIATSVTRRPELFEPSWGSLAVQRHCVPGEWMVHEGSPTSASNLEWWVRRLFSLGGTASWNLINEHAGRTADTSVLFFPYIYGSPGDPNATGTLLGLQSGTSADDVIRAIVEGIAFQLFEHAEPMLRIVPDIEQLRLAGGIKRSRPFVQLVADVFDRPVSVSASDEIGALGAVICGAVGVGWSTDYEAAMARMTAFADPVEPDPERHQALRRRFERFLGVRRALAVAWGAAQAAS